MKNSPDKNATSIVILQGFVMNIGKTQTLVSCPTSGRFDVKWKEKPILRVGDYITLSGKLITLDLGRSFIVVHAELLQPKSLRAIKNLIQEVKHGSETGTTDNR